MSLPPGVHTRLPTCGQLLTPARLSPPSQAYDRSRTGAVSLSDALRVFRSAGLSPQPSLLQRMPLTANGLPYAIIGECTWQRAREPPLYPSAPATPHSALFCLVQG